MLRHTVSLLLLTAVVPAQGARDPWERLRSFAEASGAGEARPPGQGGIE